ncbi:uncharacterized protein LOC113324753 [Papaver somniferum]|uniref:uncharacterized protein LOC113324753 n=1 Tax=Papaver somniferum TaxID=3469 RepID=UPI000E6FDAFE|nr:uncharacterized protein LOC113324753 [Papaver somniferum]
MTQEAMTKFFEMNYKVVNYDFMSRPYTSEVVDYQYPEDYTSPKFKVYDGQGNAREHLSRLIASMNDRATDGKLYLREFLKSLTKTTFTWYDNLKQGSIISWVDLSTLFLRKSYSAKRKVTTIGLRKCNQRLEKDVGKYITRFCHFALNCHEDIKEDSLVEICVRGMIPCFKKILVNFQFPAFVEIEEAAARIVDCVEESNSDYIWHNAVNTVSTTPRNTRANNKQEGWGAQTNHSYRDQLLPPPLPCSKEQIVRLLEQWVENKEIQLPPTRAYPSDIHKSDARYCHFHRRVQHPTVDCYNLGRMFQKVGEIEMGDSEGGKVTQNQVMMLSHDPSGDEWKPREEKDEVGEIAAEDPCVYKHGWRG